MNAMGIELKIFWKDTQQMKCGQRMSTLIYRGCLCVCVWTVMRKSKHEPMVSAFNFSSGNVGEIQAANNEENNK